MQQAATNLWMVRLPQHVLHTALGLRNLTCILDNNPLDFEDGSNNAPDNVDVMDADAFESLLQGDGSTATNLDWRGPTEDIREGPEPPSVSIDVGNFEAASTVVVEHFPSGSPGAPIPGAPQGQSLYEAHQSAPGDSVWAPFLSQRDWDIAHWAKTRGPTSSAVTALLAIPEVRSP